MKEVLELLVEEFKNVKSGKGLTALDGRDAEYFSDILYFANRINEELKQ